MPTDPTEQQAFRRLLPWRRVYPSMGHRRARAPP